MEHSSLIAHRRPRMSEGEMRQMQWEVVKKGRKSLSRREFLRLTGATFVTALLGACSVDPNTVSSPTNPTAEPSIQTTATTVFTENNVVVDQQHELNQADFLLKTAGIGKSFITSSQEEIDGASKATALDSQWNTKMVAKVVNQTGEEIGFAMPQDGEAMPLHQVKDGQVLKAVSFPEIEALTEKDTRPGQVLFTYTTKQNEKIMTDYFVFYGDTVMQKKMKDFIQTHKEQMQEILSVLFHFSTAPVNVLHISPRGIPEKYLNPPGIPADTVIKDTDAAITTETSIKGATDTLSDDSTHTIIRADMILNPKKVGIEAGILHFPPEALFAGIMANEAYGIATDDIQNRNGNSFRSGRSEAGSTIADIATMTQTYLTGKSNFFTKEQTTFLKAWFEVMETLS